MSDAHLAERQISRVEPMVNKGKSIIIIQLSMYLCVALTAQRPITNQARVKKNRRNIQNKYTQNTKSDQFVYNLVRNNNTNEISRSSE
jgi:hypothetical protein